MAQLHPDAMPDKYGTPAYKVFFQAATSDYISPPGDTVPAGGFRRQRQPDPFNYLFLNIKVMATPVVLITGALTGIGRAAAIAFAAAGNRVVVSGRRPDAGEALLRKLREQGAEAEFVKTDVHSEEEVRQLVEHTLQRFGRLDVTVNSAGTEGKPGPMAEQTTEAYTATFDTNVLGTILALEAAGSGVRVNAVAPGPTQTGMLDRFAGTSDRKALLQSAVRDRPDTHRGWWQNGRLIFHARRDAKRLSSNRTQPLDTTMTNHTR